MGSDGGSQGMRTGRERTDTMKKDEIKKEMPETISYEPEVEEAPVEAVPNQLEEIEKFILDLGTEDLHTFGGSKVGGKYCQQVPDEAARCILYLLESKINSYLEVGVAAGGTTFLFNHYFHPEKIVLVDNNSHPRCALRPQILSGIDYTEIINDSQSEDAIRRTGKFAPFDLIILDAVNSYMETMMDVIHYSPFLSPGGYLFLHDSVWPGGQVDRVVKELKTNDKFEFINEWVSETHPCGIALFRQKGRK
jgi:predicted O-methyltransferase YrrM